jgi:glucose/arabinose dehydrogenase
MSIARIPLPLSFGLLISAGAFVALTASCSDETEATTTSGGPSTTTTTSNTGGSGGMSSTTTTGGNGGSVGGSGGSAGGSGGSGGIPTGNYDCSAPQGQEAAVQLTSVINQGITDPLQATAPVGDPNRLFIIERRGIIRLWSNNTLSMFLDIDNLVQGGGERGLLGLAFHPDYASNGRFFVHYSDNSGDTVIAEFARSNDPNVADPNMVGQPLLQVNQPFGNHNGGSIEFSPVDGFLYIGLGDGGSSGDPNNNGQNTETRLAALLRIDVSTNPPTIPSGNVASTNAPEIYDYGLRNPYRWSFDACTGDRYIGDVGQNAWEEIDVAPANAGNMNWGWRIMEGNACYNPMNGCNMSGLALPAIDYSHGNGCSVTGGYVYRGSAIPWLRGAYIYGDYCSGTIWTLRWNNGAVTAAGVLLQTGIAISGFGQDASGELYVMDLSGDEVFRLAPN